MCKMIITNFVMIYLEIFITIFFMFQLCFFLSITFSYCVQTEPVIVAVHYNTVVERSTEIITRYEGLSLNAYPDTRWWSIWYWTRSYQGEVITKQEAWARMEAIVKQSIYRVQRDFPHATEDEIVALTSLYYNCWSGYLKVKKIWYDAWLEKWFCELPGHSGLTKRRNEEKSLLWYSME